MFQLPRLLEPPVYSGPKSTLYLESLFTILQVGKIHQLIMTHFMLL